MTPRYTAAATADTFALEDFFEATWPGSRVRFIADLDDFIARVLANPRTFARAPRGIPGREVRLGITALFPVRVIYEVTTTQVTILSVEHTRSRPRNWRRRLPPNP